MELLGIFIALFAAMFVFMHAWLRRVPVWAAALWAMGTFLFLIIVLPIYFVVRPKGDDEDDNKNMLT